MGDRNFFVLKVYKKIRSNLPDYVFTSIISLIPAYLISSLFEMFGLVVLFPVMKVIIEPSFIETNQYLNFLFHAFNFSSVVSFVLFLFSSITIIFILKNFIIFLISKRQGKIAFQLSSRLAFEKYNSYINKPYHFHTENNSAVLLRSISQIPFDLITYIVIPFIAILNEFFILFLIILVLTIYDPFLFWSLVIFLVPFLMIYNKVFKKKLKEISDRRNRDGSIIFKLGLQSMEAYREITVFNKKSYFKPVFKRTLDSYTKSIADIYLMNSFSPKIVETVAILGIFSIFIFGYALNKELTTLAQFLIVFAIAAYRVIPSMNKIILNFNHIKSSFYIFDFFDKTENQDDINQDQEPKADRTELKFDEDLVLSNLSFGFLNKKENVLKKINLRIKRGQTIGIIGSSGAGKTTLLNVLLRLYIENEGGIYVDGVKIEKSKLFAWYDLVSYVPQNITLLDGTLLENIAFGIHPDQADIELLQKVINQAQLSDFVNNLEKGVHSEIGEKGIKISGGQRQRLGIARALYHGGKILIFDEATSSLDNETEKMLTESIAHISGRDELTIVIVAHRLQTLEYCDQIFKLENGTITSSTTYQELVKEKI